MYRCRLVLSQINLKKMCICIDTFTLILFFSAGFEVIMIDNIQNGDELNTNLREIKSQITKIGKENILCILSTSSCFAPRAPDNIIEIGKICKQMNIYHVVNNAYGLQSISTCKLIQKVCT